MSASTSPTANPAADTLERVGRSSAWTITFGVLTLAVGVLILFWPGKTVVVVAVLIALQLLIAGVFYLVAALATDDAGGGVRVLIAVIGVISVLVALLMLREPLQTVTVLGLLLGLFWTASGLMEIFIGITGRTTERAMTIVSGLLALVAGIIVMVYPEISLATLAWLSGVLLVVYGLVMIGRGWTARRTSTSHRHAMGGPTGRATATPA
jgi:uncharacterized membrane protein HdeD (DUF308 family)